MQTTSIEKGWPLVSVVTVVLNDSEGLGKTMDSVLGQTYPHIDYVVIDGGSNDVTLEVIERSKERLGFFLSEPDRGIYDAMNKGIRAAKGELLLFLNAGDILHSPRVLENFVANHYRPEKSSLYLCSVVTDRGELIEPRWLRLRRYYKLPVYHQGILYPVRALRERPFDLRYSLVADFHNYFKLTATWDTVPVMPVLCRFDTSGISTVRTGELNREFIEAYHDLGIAMPFVLYRRLRLLFRR